MKVAVFDIDGTLTETTGIDNRLFADSLRHVLDLDEDPDLFEFEDVTDSGILRGLCARHTTRPFYEVETEMKGLFLELLEDAAAADPEAFRPVRGARAVFERVREAGWTPAMATGAWKRSAVLKLRVAKINIDGVPLASSTMHFQRPMIIQQALREAGGEAATPAVYVGDGIWDIKASRQLGVGFLGRGEGEGAQTLRDRGASVVLPDFSDPTLLLEGLEAAARSGWNAA